MITKIALPIEGESLSAHFGHAENFIIYELENKTIQKKDKQTPPPHEPGSIPRWLKAQGIDIIITGGIGQKAIALFNQFKIEVLSATPGTKQEEVIQAFLDGQLRTPAGGCAHHHGEREHSGHNCQ